MNRSILVGIDGAATGRAAMRWAMSRAARLGAQVVLVHVVDDEWGAFGEQSLIEIHPATTEMVAAELLIAQTAEPQVSVESRILVGEPMMELAAASRDAELVVVGTHKTGFLHGRAFGSRSIQLAAMALCPIAVIPEYVSDSRHGVMVGLDGTEAADAALSFAALEAIASEQELVIVHATEDQHTVQGHDQTDSHEQLLAVETEVTHAVRAMGVDGPVRMWRIHGSASRALVDAGGTAQLLVIGSTRRRGKELATLGPVCHDVLMNISAPTIVVHGDSAERMAYPLAERTAP